VNPVVRNVLADVVAYVPMAWIGARLDARSSKKA
jgi:hypothetical protein